MEYKYICYYFFIIARRFIKCCVLPSVVITLISSVYVTLGILFWTTIPSPLMRKTQMITDKGIFPLFSNVQIVWLETIDIRITGSGDVDEPCSAWNISIVNGSNCDSLPVLSYQSDDACNVFVHFSMSQSLIASPL